MTYPVHRIKILHKKGNKLHKSENTMPESVREIYITLIAPLNITRTKVGTQEWMQFKSL
jgi:hypothetical protein